ncbi:MAG: adenosylhomocysteinase [Thermoplasmata archaeon]
MTNEGVLRLNWAKSHMFILNEIENRFRKEKPFANLKIGMALHVEAKTGVLALTLKNGGAKVKLASCNPLSSDDLVVNALKENIDVYARKGESDEEYYENLNKVLDFEPDIIIDDGGDLTYLIHKSKDFKVIGGNEETTTGVVRLKALEKKGVLKFPIFDVNDAKMKHLFDNRYGTGQSTIDGLMTATNLSLAGKNIVVAGYGWCGRGIANRLRGLGAKITVTEIDSVKAVEAHMDGFNVTTMIEAIKNADFVITATGMKDVVRAEHLKVAKNGCILANAGHFDVEISKRDLEKMAISKSNVRKSVDLYEFQDNRKIYLLSEGRLVNLAAGQGHPVEIMDLSFSLQALTAEYVVKKRDTLKNKVYSVPEEIDEYVAEAALRNFNISLDKLNDEQKRYYEDWETGT